MKARLKITGAITALFLVAALAILPDAATPTYAAGPATGTLIVVNPTNQASRLIFSVTAEAPTQSTPGEVRLTNAIFYVGGLILDQVTSIGSDGLTYTYNVTSVAADAAKNNTVLTKVEFVQDLTGGNPAIGASAFEGATNLTEVIFPARTNSIAQRAFYGCTKLSTVTWPAKAEIYSTATNIVAIGASAFAECTALTHITIPAITNTQRNPDFYSRYGAATGGNIPIYWSSYLPNAGAGAHTIPYRTAIHSEAFKNCTELTTIIFAPSGTASGLWAYFGSSSTAATSLFTGCDKLQTVVFNDTQPFYANPDGSVSTRYTADKANQFESSGVNPQLYYAVNYYATDSAAINITDGAGQPQTINLADDYAAELRYARVDYLRGTSIADIATSNTSALQSNSDTVLTNLAAYDTSTVLSGTSTLRYADGAIPDPRAVAVAAGLDSDADPNTRWVWKLGNYQSHRVGLSDSCYAYLAPVTDIAGGRVLAPQITTMYKLAVQNFSQGRAPVLDSPFDVLRYYSTDHGSISSVTTHGVGYYRFDDTSSARDLSLDKDAGGNYTEWPWFITDSNLQTSFFDKISVYAPNGTLLSAGDYDVSFERYDNLSTSGTYGMLVPATLGQTADGPLLMSITPNGTGTSSGLTGVLKEWVLIKGQSGTVLEKYTSNASDTLSAATTDTSYFTSPYAVAISSADLTSALVATAYAGLMSAPVDVLDTTTATYGFALGRTFNASGHISDTNSNFTQYSSSSFSSPAAFAVGVYEAFERCSGQSCQRDNLGITDLWSDTAVLVAANSLDDVAAAASAYAYGKKAPIFYTESDGSVSADTLRCLNDFANVVVLGDSTRFSTAVYDELNANAAANFNLSRLASDVGSAASLSLKVAQTLLAEGLVDSRVVTITNASNLADAFTVLSLSGHEHGLALVSAGTADSKRISAWLHDQRDTVRTVRLFGRGSSNMSSSSYNFAAVLTAELWNNNAIPAAISDGDTLVLNGVQLTIGAGNELLYAGDRLWGTATLPAGIYAYDGVNYELKVTAIGPDDAPNSGWLIVNVTRDLNLNDGSNTPSSPGLPTAPTTPAVNTPSSNTGSTNTAGTGWLSSTPFSTVNNSGSSAIFDDGSDLPINDTSSNDLPYNNTSDQNTTNTISSTDGSVAWLPIAVVTTVLLALAGACYFVLRQKRAPRLPKGE